MKAEGLGVTGKTVVTFLVLYYDSKQGANGDLVLLAFALGQLYSVCVLLKYINSYGMPRSLLKQRQALQSDLFLHTKHPKSR